MAKTNTFLKTGQDAPRAGHPGGALAH